MYYISFSGKRNIIFPDNTRKIIFQRYFFGKIIFSEHLEKENVVFCAVNQLIVNLRNTIETDELYIISILLNVSLSVRCENTLSKLFKTDTGAPQGDSASAL